MTMRCLSMSSAVFGSPKRFEIVGRRVDVEVQREKPALDQVRLRRRAQADRDVGLAHGDVELRIVEDQLKLDARIEVDELVDARGEPGRADADRRRDAQRAGRLAARIDELRAHVLELQDDVARRAHQKLAFLGQDQAARVAVEERRAELLFERAHLTAHRRLAHVEQLAGARERAFLGGGVEDAQLVPVDLAALNGRTRLLNVQAVYSAASRVASTPNRYFSASSAAMQPIPAAVTA